MLDRIRRVDHRSARGTWQMEFLAPPPTLAPFVRRIKAYAERYTDFVRRRELPTGRAVLLDWARQSEILYDSTVHWKSSTIG